MKQKGAFVYIISLFTGLLLVSFSTGTKQELQAIKYDDDLSLARWIGVQKKAVPADSLLYASDPAPLFRKEFGVEKAIRSATLFITAAGYYRSSLNGKRIGQQYLDPAWTDFAKRIYYSEYDLTATIKRGDNCLGVTLGKGFYDPLPMKLWGNLNLRRTLPTGSPVFIARLKLLYVDGSSAEIVTDDSWTYAHGPVQTNNVYLGELYDAGKAIAGWEYPGFTGAGWKQAVVQEGPSGSLQKAFFPPVEITGSIRPVSISAVKNGKYLADMGVNFTGTYRIRVHGKQGDTIHFRFGERIFDNGELNTLTTVAGQIKQANGGPGAPAIAWQEDRYVFGAGTDAWYSPEFTSHTFRYMEIAGLAAAPTFTDLEGLPLNTNVADRGNFTCSVPLLNDIQQITGRTFLNNLVTVQSDCPARERFGYGGDLNATREAYICNYDMQAFYRKTVYDWVDAMNDSIFVDTAPYVGINYCGLSWESAFLLTQYDLLLYYQDTALVREMYATDLEWMEKVARIHPNGIVDKGLSDHEALEPVPVELTGTAHYLQCAGIMQRFASFMGDRKQEKHFEVLAGTLRNLILNQFWRQPVLDPVNRQTLFATLLYHNIIPVPEISRATDSLLAAIAVPGKHFITGIFGTKYILEALSATGNAQAVYDIINSRAYPGWGHMIDKGATTLWETWKESDNTFSNCHPMFGSVSEWFYRWLGGIRPDPKYPGFKKFFINPSMPAGLAQVSASYHSPFGKIISDWKNEGRQKQVFNITIPGGSSALLTLPARSEQKLSFTANSTGHSFIPKSRNQHSCSFELPAGSYTILVQQ